MDDIKPQTPEVMLASLLPTQEMTWADRGSEAYEPSFGTYYTTPPHPGGMNLELRQEAVASLIMAEMKIEPGTGRCNKFHRDRNRV